MSSHPLRGTLLPLLLLLGACAPEPRTFSAPDGSGFHSVEFSRDGARLYVSGGEHLVYGLEGEPIGAAAPGPTFRLVQAQGALWARGQLAGASELRLLIFDLDGGCLHCEPGLVPTVGLHDLAASADGSRLVAHDGRTVFPLTRGSDGRLLRGDYL